MQDDTFESAADRIAFSEAVDFLEQGRGQLIPADKIEYYVRRGLMAREGERIQLTDEGRQQHEIAQRERFTDG
jgi:hypothetical protein